MSFPQNVADAALVACGRCCCICHKFCGTKIELHHIKQVTYGGDNSFDNCIPLCLDCHADMGKADPNHNKGKKYTENELRMHRDNWYRTISEKTRDGSLDLGKNNNHAIKSNKPISNYLNELKCGSFAFDYSNNNGQYTIGEGYFQFTTMWTKASDKCIHAYNDASDIDSIARIKGPCELEDALSQEIDFSSRCRTPNVGDIVVWKNKNGKYAATKIVSILDDSRGADHDELTCEYIIFME